MVCLSNLPAIFVGLTRSVATDIRTIIDDDARLQSGIAGALEQYNLDQSVTVDAPDENHQARRTPPVVPSSLIAKHTTGYRQRVWSGWRSKGQQIR